MLQLVSEQYDSHMDGMEYGLFGPERIAQLEQADLDQYHRSILKTSSYCASMDDGSGSNADEDANTDQETINEVLLQFRDETKSEMAELKAQLSVIISILQNTNYGEAAIPILPTQAANEIDESAGQFPTEIHGNYINCDSVEEKFVESLNDNIVEPSSHNLFDEMSRPLPIELMVEDVCSVLGKMTAQNDAANVLEEMPHPNSIVNSICGSLIENESKPTHLVLPIFGKMADHHNACKVFAEMTEPFLVENMLDTAVTKASHKLLDERHVLSQVALDGDFNGKKDSLSPYPYIIEGSSSVNGSRWIPGLLIGSSKVSTQNFNSEDDVLGVIIADSQSFSKMGFNPQVFDPGTLTFFKQNDYENQLNENKSLIHCISPEHFLIYPQVHGADNPINRNNISTLTLAISINRPFSDFHDGASAQICYTFDQAAPRLGNGHDIGAGHSNVYVATVSTLIQMVLFGDEFCLIDFSHFRMLNSDNHAIIVLILDSIAQGHRFTKSLFEEANPKLMSNYLCCWTLSLDSLTNELELMICFASRISFWTPLRAKISWDPGIYTIFANILEDKDDFDRVGKWITAMDHRIELTVTKLIHTTFGEGNHGNKNYEGFAQNGYLDIFSSASKEWMAFLNMLPSKHLVKFAQLHIWWHYVKFRQEQIGNYLNDCLRVSRPYFNKALVRHSKFICNNILMKWSSVEIHAFGSNILKHGVDGNVLAIINHSFEIRLAVVVKSMMLVRMKGFVWDPGRDFCGNCVSCKTESHATIGKHFDTTSPVTKAVGSGVYNLELGGFLVIVPYEKHSIQWYDCFMRVWGYRFHKIESAQNIETSTKSVEMIMLNGVELTLPTKQGWSVWWEDIFQDIAMILCLDEAFCQIKKWNSFSMWQMSMTEERNMLQAWNWINLIYPEPQWGVNFPEAAQSRHKAMNVYEIEASNNRQNQFAFKSICLWTSLFHLDAAIMVKSIQRFQASTLLCLVQQWIFPNDDDGVAVAKLETFVCDPGVCHFTTLRTRRLFRGGICHKSILKLYKLGPLVIVTSSTTLLCYYVISIRLIMQVV